VGEGHIDGHRRFSSFSFDTTKRNDFLTRGNELFRDEVNVESSIEAGEKSIEHILKALEMAATHGHPFRHIVDDVRRLETSQRFSMSWHGSFVKGTNAFLVFFLGHFSPRSLYMGPMLTRNFSGIPFKLSLSQYSAKASSG
jgi:hypothetical protein